MSTYAWTEKRQRKFKRLLQESTNAYKIDSVRSLCKLMYEERRTMIVADDLRAVNMIDSSENKSFDMVRFLSLYCSDILKEHLIDGERFWTVRA